MNLNVIKAKHIRDALREIDEHAPPKSRESYVYDLVLKGKEYPPKYVIAIASRIANGYEPTTEDYNAVQAKDYLSKLGFKITEKVRGKRSPPIQIASEDDESSSPEGQRKSGWHTRCERDASIVKKAKEQRLKRDADLLCEVCGFSFFEVYGMLGEVDKRFIEAHHTVPIAELNGPTKTKVKDLALLCANCHRAIHRIKPMLSVSELRDRIKDIAAKANKRTK